LCFKEGMYKPVEIKIENTIENIKYSNQKIKKHMMNLRKSFNLNSILVKEFSVQIGPEGNHLVRRFFNSLLFNDYLYKPLLDQLLKDLKQKSLRL